MEFATNSKIADRIILGKVNPSSPTDEAVDEYIDILIQMLKDADQPFVFINDVSESKILSAEQRIKFGNLYKDKKIKALIEEKVLGVVYVVPSPIIQLVLNGIFLVAKPPVPYKVVNRLNEALQWAQNCLLEYDSSYQDRS